MVQRGNIAHTSRRSHSSMPSVDEEVEDVIGRLKAAVGASLFDRGAARGGPSLFDRTYDADVPRSTVDDDFDPVPSPVPRRRDDAALDDDAPGRHSTANYLHRGAADDEVRDILANLYRVAVTGGPIPEDLKDPAWDDRELPRWDAPTRAKWDPHATTPYVMEGVMPPWHAKSYYKVVAAVPKGAVRASTSERAAELMRGVAGADGGGRDFDGTRGSIEYVSIYDGVTMYAPGLTVCHPAKDTHGGGLYVAESIEGCLKRDKEMFPAASAMLTAPRAIARVRCWNPDRLEEPVRYGGKLAFTCCHVDEILPYPTTWGAGIKGAGTRTWCATNDENADGNSNVLRSSAEFRYSVFSPSKSSSRVSYDDAMLDDAAAGMFGSRGATPSGTPMGLRGVVRKSTEAGSGLGELVDDEAAAIVAELEARAVAGVQAAGRRREAERTGAGGKVAEAETKGAERLLRAQAKTVSLEEEVRAMERRLDRARYGV